MREKRWNVDFCVVGGGLSGMAAAIAAARHGVRTALIHDRPVLGGNASSEVRMWICGAHGPNHRETGIVEEIELENFYRNSAGSWSIWDSVLYEKARFQDGLELFLNCSACRLDMDGDRIRSVTAWQTTTQTWHTVEANLFADCSGDSVLAPLCGAEFRVGREGRSEFGESIAPARADRKTMGMSCLIQARETPHPQKFIPPRWAYVYETDEDLPNRGHHLAPLNNFWWIELGGEQDSIHDTEAIRDELLRAAFGVWDHIKNRGDHGAENWTLDWVGFLPGKRESRRYVGDYILTQNDVRAEGRFEDTVAYGGWSMDDHHPGGLRWPGKPTIFHPAPSPYGIPFRCLYSRNVPNLMFAGRNISVTHAAMSSTRVMATCAILGQAVGTAAAIAVHDALTPRQVGAERIHELQQTLLDDDCWLPGLVRTIPMISRKADLLASSGDPGPLRNGVDRPDENGDNAWTAPPNAWVEYRFSGPTPVSRVRLVFDSDLNRKRKNMPCQYPLDFEPYAVPASMVRTFAVEVQTADGLRRRVHRETENHRRLVWVPLPDEKVTAVRFLPEAAWGAEIIRVFAFDIR